MAVVLIISLTNRTVSTCFHNFLFDILWDMMYKQNMKLNKTLKRSLYRKRKLLAEIEDKKS